MVKHLRRSRLWLTVAGIVLALSGTALLGSAITDPTLPNSTPSAAEGSGTVAPQTEMPRPDQGRTGAAERPQPSEAPGPLLLSTSEPASIAIPAIGVRSVIQQVGLTASRTLEVPAPGPYYDDAAWYRHSSTPGAAGPAVIIGHVDSAANGPSVFFDLRHLEVGDEVQVTRRDGSVAIFSVDAVDQYPKDEFPTELVYGNTDHAALRLITCGGDFDRASRSYDDNVVVFASLIRSVPADSPVLGPSGAL